MLLKNIKIWQKKIKIKPDSEERQPPGNGGTNRVKLYVRIISNKNYVMALD